jgi:HEAT repeat protein
MLPALRVTSSIFIVVLLSSISVAQTPARSETAEDELLLKEAKVATDGPGLLEFFRRRIPADKDKTRITGLIRQLGSSNFQAREKATQELTALGPVTLPDLRKAQKDADAEVKRRASQCVEAIEKEASPTVTAAAVRLLKARAPAGAAAVLLAFLPLANDDSVKEEIATALLSLGVKDGKVDSALVAALEDQAPARKAVAAMIVARFGTPEQKDAVRKLLKDSDPRVRFRAAQGLVAARETNAIPMLVALVGDSPMENARQAEDLLTRIAGDRSPKINLEEDKTARRKCRDAWESWWQANNAKLDLAEVDVDLITTNPTAQGRKVAQQFLDAVAKGDVAALKRTSAVPFRMPGEREFKTRDELGKFFEEMTRERPPREMTMAVQNMVSIDEYAKIAPEQEKASLNQLRGPQVRAIYISIDMAGQRTGATIFVRLSGGQAKIVGIGEGHPARQEIQVRVKQAPPAVKLPAEKAGKDKEKK